MKCGKTCHTVIYKKKVGYSSREALSIAGLLGGCDFSVNHSLIEMWKLPSGTYNQISGRDENRRSPRRWCQEGEGVDPADMGTPRQQDPHPLPPHPLLGPLLFSSLPEIWFYVPLGNFHISIRECFTLKTQCPHSPAMDSDSLELYPPSFLYIVLHDMFYHTPFLYSTILLLLS